MTDVTDVHDITTRPAQESGPQNGSLPPTLEHADQWTDQMVAQTRIPMYDVPFVTVGGGMGSFLTVDYLRVAGGAPVSDIRVLSNLSHPWQTYEYLTRVSQLPRDKRIRSDSSSRPDNIWGFPSYAMQEAAREATVAPLLQVLLEPVFADFYTPKLGAVLDGIEREAHRIRYWDMLVQGEVQVVRRRVGGGYFTLIAPRGGQHPVTFRSRDVHLAVGYPGVRFMPDMRAFRERLGDFHHVVNGYEDHEHVYQALCRRPGVVLVRGGGIVASAVTDRLISDRLRHGLQTQIVHLFRTYYAGAHGPHGWARRRGSNGFAYQGFNYPKSTWGGQLRFRMRRMETASDRVRVYDEIGGTTTAWRRHWQRHLREATRAGWYRTQAGTITDLRLDGDALVARIQGPEAETELGFDYMIDCTGLDADMTGHRVIDDLLRHGGAGRNPLGRLDVEPSFELRGAASGMGRIYVTGAASYGGYFPGVDTFLGLQIAAQEVVDDLARRGMCRDMRPVRSTVEWLKWVANRRI
ncbi:hypothetical protein [Actinophytocola sp.]|uniref:hypothetical protein n=1 Tax=Actinophytocola sp. TaxID=1872138 RepID=UPI002D7E3E6E|nr:hypothetical protein [Actinophytocola sp.]HET9143340.1 hypothetical protein [Actinophytocola sp.]